MMWKLGVGAIWKYTISKSSETSQAFVAVEVGIRLKLLATIGRMFRQSKKTLCCGGSIVTSLSDAHLRSEAPTYVPSPQEDIYLMKQVSSQHMSFIVVVIIILSGS